MFQQHNLSVFYLTPSKRYGNQSDNKRVTCQQSVNSEEGRRNVEGVMQGSKAEYFPGMPQGFPTRGDVRAARMLARMATMLHAGISPSSRWPGHAERLCGHRRRVAAEGKKF
jgi:hypothetical protein